MLTVHELRKRGFKVQVRHNRCYREYLKDLGYNVGMCGGFTLQSKGGSTKVVVSPPDNGVSVVGVAECNPKDNFDRKRGVRIALGRALKQMGMCTK